MKPNDSNRNDRMREVLQGLPLVEADSEYRELLARRFVSGDITPAPWHSLRRARLSVLSWAAAVLALVTTWAVLELRPRQLTWSVVAASGGITLDGQSVEAEDSSKWSEGLRGGTRVFVAAGGEMTVASAAGVVVQLTAGTEMTLPSAGRWPWQESWRSEIASGEARITTAERFQGKKLLISSDEALIEVTGTTLAVIRTAGSTCVCVFAGRVRMGVPDGSLQIVNEGTRHLIFTDGQPDRTEDILPMERMKLEMLRNQRETILSK